MRGILVTKGRINAVNNRIIKNEAPGYYLEHLRQPTGLTRVELHSPLWWRGSVTFHLFLGSSPDPDLFQSWWAIRFGVYTRLSVPCRPSGHTQKNVVGYKKKRKKKDNQLRTISEGDMMTGVSASIVTKWGELFFSFPYTSLWRHALHSNLFQSRQSTQLDSPE